MYEIIAGIIFAVVLSALVIEKRSKQDKNDDEKLSLSEIESKIETHNDESQTQEENHNAEEKTPREEQTNQTNGSQRQLEAQSQTLKAQDSHKLGRKYQRAGDYGKAVYWYKKAAEQGHVYAQYDLAVMYHDGEGVNWNYCEAFRLFRESAAQGYSRAQYRLGNMYFNGEFVRKNYREALKWYRKAAEQGHIQAQFMLGSMYYDGDGVRANLFEAVKWYHRAARQ